MDRGLPLCTFVKLEKLCVSTMMVTGGWGLNLILVHSVFLHALWRYFPAADVQRPPSCWPEYITHVKESHATELLRILVLSACVAFVLLRPRWVPDDVALLVYTCFACSISEYLGRIPDEGPPAGKQRHNGFPLQPAPARMGAVVLGFATPDQHPNDKTRRRRE